MTADGDAFDWIIVGGGSAGCVLANRLSANPSIRVLLIEAGPDFAPGEEPAALRDPGVRSVLLPQFYWSELVHETGPMPQAKVMGGGSAINGMHAQRGLPRDYDEWRELGTEGWGWDDVLPYFKRLETDLDFDGPAHGKDGPIAIARVTEPRWSELTRALRNALDARGLPRLSDLNAADGDGSAPTPLSCNATTRMSTAAGYLTAAVRGRPNLAIMADTQVRRVIFDDRRASGVETVDGRQWRAGEVVICSGAIHSPTLLLRSGVGDGSALQAAEVPVIADRKGVGRNLRNHPMLTITIHTKRSGRQHNFRDARHPGPMIARYSSNFAGAQPTDMVFNLWERLPGPLANDPLGRQLTQLMIILNKSYSMGEVTLDAGDPSRSPHVRANLLSDARDIGRMVEAFRFSCDLLGSPQLSSLINEAYVIDLSKGVASNPFMRRLLQDNLRARLLSVLGAIAVDLAPFVGRHVMRGAGRTTAAILAKSDAISAIVRDMTAVGGHPAGTCRLGSVEDPQAVVDSRCRVIGVERLRVVDASIFPTPLTAGTNIPVIMAAEKAADCILNDRKAAGGR